MAKLDIDDLLKVIPAGTKAKVLRALAGLGAKSIGVTPENILAYYDESVREAQKPDTRADVTGKFEHGLRLGESPTGVKGKELPRLGAGVDAIWELIDQDVRAVVDAVLDAAGKE